MAKFPLLTAQRLTLEPFGEKFLTDKYVGWLNDPEVTRYSQQRFRKHDMDSCRRFMASFEQGPNHFSAIVANDSALGHIGNISTSIDTQNGVADIAIMVGEKQVWGKGYGLEAWIAAMKGLFADPNIRLVTGGCIADNMAMRTVMEKAGMAPYYTRAGYFMWEGRPVDSVHYAADRMTWTS